MRQLQSTLQTLGFFPSTIAPTGVFGPATREAVRAFQAANGLPQVGVVGPATRAALNTSGSPAAETPASATSVPSSESTPPPPVQAPTSDTNTTYTFTENLSRGSSGEDVRQLQTKLQDLGFLPTTIQPTGVFGPATQQAVRAFQAANGISQAGTVGPATRAALNK